MAKFLRGALVEYGGNLLGPIPNVVVFQFNPEQLARTITIPTPPAATGGTDQRRTVETGQTATPPTETLTITANFSAADDLGRGGALSAVPRVFGIGPQLAALEKMVYPPSQVGGLIGAAIDAIGSAISGSAGSPPTRTVPRERLPRVLFIWGLTRILPVRITSMTLTEQQFDFLLNPVQAQVQIGLAVAGTPPAGDLVAKGALTYSQGVKDAQAMLNLVKTIELMMDMIPF